MIASKVKTHCTDKTTSVLLIHDIVRIHSSRERFKDLQHDVSKIATHVEALMSRNDDDEGYEFAQQAKDSSDDDTLQSASYEVMRKTKTRAPLFFNLVLRPGAAHDLIYEYMYFFGKES